MRSRCASKTETPASRARCSGKADRGARLQSASMISDADVVIVGAGQAGLSLSHELRAATIEHVVLERGRIGETWRGRWDSFCLVIPNWTVQLPGGPYRGDDPNGFMPKDEIVSHLVAYAESFRAPVREGVTVTSLEAAENASFLLRTSSREIRAKRVV